VSAASFTEHFEVPYQLCSDHEMLDIE